MRSSTELPVTLSVLDRLIDLAPAQPGEPPLSRAQSLRILRSAVRRDLEWLLNSRRIPFGPHSAFVEVNRSVYMMGLEDFAAFSLADGQEQSRLLRHIQAVIRQFEPRLANVQISLQDDPIKTRRMRFRIEASLVVDPAPERISFDTILQLSSGEYVINEES
jgi:type VI secretion system protein ImpF